ncbi:MAG TPA: chemotaxis protein CheB, partial [Pseudolabrys sp.]|nr:chemotaxis protein CheB [Pseudolabrys sp.]
MPARCPQNLRLTALPSSEGRSISRRLIGELGGCTVVQDPDDAAFIEMPINALKLTQPDHVVALDDMPALLTRLAHQQAG